MSDANITPFEASSSPDFGGPFRTVCLHFSEAMDSVDIDWKKKMLNFQVQSEHVDLDAKVRVSEDDETLQFSITLPLRISNEKMRPLAAEYLCRAQWGLVVGNFEFDFRDGQVDFHIAHVMENQTVADDTIFRLFSTGLRMFDRYLPGLMQVVFGGNTPSDAIYLAELDMHDDDVTDEPVSMVTPKKRKPITRRKKKAPNGSASDGSQSGKPEEAHSNTETSAMHGIPRLQDQFRSNLSEGSSMSISPTEEEEF